MGAAVKVDVGKRRELLIGCGQRRDKVLWHPDHREWEGLVTLDNNPDVKPDIVHDLNHRPLPFDANYFDEIHAYEVLEHIGRQGDAVGFFEEFTEYWTILKPGGALLATVPRWNSIWAFSDPSHTRVISEGTLTFLIQPEYEKAKKENRSMTDYRNIYKADFDAVHINRADPEHFEFGLIAVKPSRIEEGR